MVEIRYINITEIIRRAVYELVEKGELSEKYANDLLNGLKRIENNEGLALAMVLDGILRKAPMDKVMVGEYVVFLVYEDDITLVVVYNPDKAEYEIYTRNWSR